MSDYQQVEIIEDEQYEEIGWHMFEKMEPPLGSGSYGTVYKVKCLRTTRYCPEDPNKRISFLDQENQDAPQISLILNGTQQQKSEQNNPKDLIKDKFYVIKVVDVSQVTLEQGYRALDEIQMMMNITSPHIVQYIDSFIIDQQVNIVLEFCDNLDLSSCINNWKQNYQKTLSTLQLPIITENLIWRIFINICLGVQYLHQNDIVHRDLKSMNILMTQQNQAKIADFGCSKFLQDDYLQRDNEEYLNNDLDENNMDQTLIGTPLYLAPEIWTNKRYSKSSDIWALGVILYELACESSHPFPAYNIDELQDKVINDEIYFENYDRESKFFPIICKLLNKDYNQRPGIDEIIQDQEFQVKMKYLRIDQSFVLKINDILRKRDRQLLIGLQNLRNHIKKSKTQKINSPNKLKFPQIQRFQSVDIKKQNNQEEKKQQNELEDEETKVGENSVIISQNQINFPQDQQNQSLILLEEQNSMNQNLIISQLDSSNFKEINHDSQVQEIQRSQISDQNNLSRLMQIIDSQQNEQVNQNILDEREHQEGNYFNFHQIQISEKTINLIEQDEQIIFQRIQDEQNILDDSQIMDVDIQLQSIDIDVLDPTQRISIPHNIENKDDSKLIDQSTEPFLDFNFAPRKSISKQKQIVFQSQPSQLNQVSYQEKISEKKNDKDKNVNCFFSCCLFFKKK